MCGWGKTIFNLKWHSIHPTDRWHVMLQAISFIVGYSLQDIKLSVYIGLGGTALTFLAVVPPWPFYNQHPVKWLPVGGGTSNTSRQNIVVDEKILTR